MGDDLGAQALQPATPEVELVNGEEASGLADMLHQYISQNIEESATKRAQARLLEGSIAFQAAEDTDLCVQIRFEPGLVRIEDSEGLPAGVPSICADFISISHLTTGQAGPFSLICKRRMRVSFSARHITFLLRALRFMQVPGEDSKWTAMKPWLAASLAIALAALLIYWLAY